MGNVKTALFVIFLALWGAGSCFVWAGPAAAQERPADKAKSGDAPQDDQDSQSHKIEENCNPPGEVMVILKQPKRTAPNIWDTLYGLPDRQERFVSAMPVDNGDTVVAGERYVFSGADVQLFLARVQGEGRVVWEEAHKVKGLRAVRSILPVDKGYMVIGEKIEGEKPAALWFGFFDTEGRLLSEHTHQASGSLTFTDIAAAGTEKGRYYWIAAQEQPDSALPFAVFFKASPEGKILQERAYNLGFANRVQGLTALSDGTFLGAGYAVTGSGKKNGWLIRLDAQGRLMWQRQYPRGLSAVLNGAALLAGGQVMVAGQIKPASAGSAMAGWIASLNPSDGTPVWQTYLSGRMHYEGRAVLPVEGGAAMILLSADKPAKSEYKNFARVLTMSPNGTLLRSDSYFSAQGAQALKLTPGAQGQILLVGESLNAHQSYSGEGSAEGPAGGGSKKTQSLDGWMAAFGTPQPYRNPCAAGSVSPAGAP